VLFNCNKDLHFAGASPCLAAGIIRAGQPFGGGLWRWAKNGCEQGLGSRASEFGAPAAAEWGLMAAFSGSWLLLLPAAISAAVAWVVLEALLRRTELLPVAVPNARSLHIGQVPRGGGVAIWAGWFAGTLWLAGAKPWLAPLLAVIAVSLRDDRKAVPPPVRLAVHAGAAATWLWLAGAGMIGFGGALVALLAIVWMTNLYNFMDGSDGLAGAMTMVGFGAYAAGAWFAGAGDAPLLLALAAASAPFLLRNAPPARIFLGDVGSAPLGFLAAVFGFTGWRDGWWPAWFPLLVFLPFIADATVTLTRRLLQGARVWQAHREHYYQRLVRLGLGHGGTLALHAAFMIAAAGSAVLALIWNPAWGTAALVGWSALLAFAYAAIEYHWRRRSKRPS
jgi:UDP-N-acetylmuramyl pentapeptide phosphotransferase/UDP-N-acetylglucosamine-1-phosphate transferase